jgi:hypothetical protein
MGLILAPFKNLLRFHKIKMLIVFGIAIFLTIIMFPNDDLSDYISATVARTSGIYLQMNNLSLSVLPGPGVDADDIVVEQKGLPALKAGSAHASISLMKALTLKAGASAELKKIFGGDVAVDYAQDGKAKSGTPFDQVTINASSVSLEALMDFLAAANLAGPKMHGIAKVFMDTLRIDHGFGEQPSLKELSLDVPSLSFPAQTLMTQMGPQPIPTLELGRASLKKTSLNDGVLTLGELSLGDPKGEFSAKISGHINLNMRKLPNGIGPELSNINLAIKLSADKDFVNHNRDLFSGFLALMGSCKTDTPKGIEVACNLSIPTLGAVPNFTPMMK